MDLAGLAVLNRDGGAGVIDEQFLTGVVLLPKGELLGVTPLAVQVAEPRISVPLGLRLLVLAPDQLEREVPVGLQLLMDAGEVWRGVASPAGWGRSLAEQEFLQSAFREVFRQRPANLGGLSQFEVLVDGALDDRATAGDLVLGQPQGAESQDLADFAHGQSLFRQADSP